MKTICKRLRRGQDLLMEIKRLCVEQSVSAGVVLSAVGCVSHARLRDASGVNIQDIDRHLEIVSLNGTVSAARCHLHAAFSAEDLTTIGGHLVEGCIINTTCELVIGLLEGMEYGVEQDEETGYDEIVFNIVQA